MTVGELIKKLQTFDASEEAIVAINTGDVGIPGRLDFVGHDANAREVTLVHTCVDPNIDANANTTRLDKFIDAALYGEL